MHADVALCRMDEEARPPLHRGGLGLRGDAHLTLKLPLFSLPLAGDSMRPRTLRHPHVAEDEGGSWDKLGKRIRRAHGKLAEVQQRCADLAA